MTAIPDKTILNGSSNPTTSQFKGQMGQLWDYLNERNDVNATVSGLKVSTNKKLLGRNTSGAGAIEEITYTDQGYSMLTGATQLGFRNKVINGSCRVAQRGTVALTNASLQYGGADAHIANLSATTASGSIIQVLGIGSSGFGFGVTNATTTGATSGALIHRIESLNTKDLNGQTVTVSLKVYHDFGSNTNFGIGLFKANSSDNFTTTTQIGATSTTSVATATTTSLTASFTLNSTDASNGLQIAISFTSAALTSKSFYWSDIQLEVGSVATPFEHRPYGTELALCQRYYQELTVPAFYIPATAATAMYIPVYLKQTMRVAPSITMPSSTNVAYNAAGALVTPSGFTTTAISPDSFSINVSNASLGGVVSAVYKLSSVL